MTGKLTSNNSVNIEFEVKLDSTYNNTQSQGGFRDEVESLGLDFDECKFALTKDFTKGIPTINPLVKEVEPVDFELLKRQNNPFEGEAGTQEETDWYNAITEVNVDLSTLKIAKDKKVQFDMVWAKADGEIGADWKLWLDGVQVKCTDSVQSFNSSNAKVKDWKTIFKTALKNAGNSVKDIEVISYKPTTKKVLTSELVVNDKFGRIGSFGFVNGVGDFITDNNIK